MSGTGTVPLAYPIQLIQGDDCQGATYRLRILKEGIIYFIHGGKVGHIGQEDANPDHILHARSSLFKYG